MNAIKTSFSIRKFSVSSERVGWKVYYFECFKNISQSHIFIYSFIKLSLHKKDSNAIPALSIHCMSFKSCCFIVLVMLYCSDAMMLYLRLHNSKTLKKLCISLCFWGWWFGAKLLYVVIEVAVGSNNLQPNHFTFYISGILHFLSIFLFDGWTLNN